MNTPLRPSSSNPSSQNPLQTPSTSSSSILNVTPLSQTGRKQRERARTPEEKIELVLEYLKTLNLTLAEFLFLLFRLEDKSHKDMAEYSTVNGVPAANSSTRVKRTDIHKRMLKSWSFSPLRNTSRKDLLKKRKILEP
jgi:hypothetical protein